VPAGGRIYRARLKFWPKHRGMVLRRTSLYGARPAGCSAFDAEAELAAPDAPGAAAMVLALAAALSGLASPRRLDEARAVGANEAHLRELDVSDLPPGSPLNLWRAQDGWMLVFTRSVPTWRTFCGAFLNRDVARTAASRAWADGGANLLVTQVLDTHRADDAAGACLTYSVPASVVAGWRDSEAPGLSKSLSEHLAWGAIEELASSAEAATKETG
jgi:hypothetical protein